MNRLLIIYLLSSFMIVYCGKTYYHNVHNIMNLECKEKNQITCLKKFDCDLGLNFIYCAKPARFIQTKELPPIEEY